MNYEISSVFGLLFNEDCFVPGLFKTHVSDKKWGNGKGKCRNGNVNQEMRNENHAKNLIQPRSVEDPPRRGFSLQPRVGAERLPWEMCNGNL